MPSLRQLLEEQKPLVDETFGTGSYEIADCDDLACIVRTPGAEVRLGYDPRDQWLAADITALGVQDSLREPHIVEIWLRFLDRSLPRRRKSQLDTQQLKDELLVVRQILKDIFADPQRARDAANFCAGYGAAYNDYYAGEWG